MNTDLLDSQEFVLSIRVLTSFASILLFYWAVRSLVVRCKAKLYELSDITLVIVGVYWAIYNTFILLKYDGNAWPGLTIYRFNMRFGLLLTLVTFISLIKDRLLVSQLCEYVADQKTKEGPDELGS